MSASTINGKPIETVSKQEALDFLYTNKNVYMGGFEPGEDAVEAFNCLIEILESDTIKVTDLPSYGASDQDFV